MALTGGIRIEGADIPAIANGALSKYTAVKLSTDSNGDRRVATCGTTDKPLGIVQDDAADGENCTIRIAGVSLVAANGDFLIGDELVVAAADGELDTYSTDAWSVGIALHAATAAHDLVPCRLGIHYHKA